MMTEPGGPVVSQDVPGVSGVEHPLDLPQAVAQARVADAQRQTGVLILYVDENQSPARDGSYRFIAISHGVSKRVRRGAAVTW